MGAQKFNQSVLFAGGVEASDKACGGAVEPVAVGELTVDELRGVRRVRVQVTALEVAIAAADDYGSAKICDLPDTNMMLLSASCMLDLVKGGTASGLVAATDISTAIGTAAASNATLSATMVNVIDIVANTDDQLTHDMDAHSADNTPANMPLQIADGASSALYLNLAAAITADDTLTATGWVELLYIDLGK